jgi:hypothetical protein
VKRGRGRWKEKRKKGWEEKARRREKEGEKGDRMGKGLRGESGKRMEEKGEREDVERGRRR